MIVVKTANIYVTYLHLTTKGSELHLYQSLCICNAYLTPLIAYLQIVVYNYDNCNVNVQIKSGFQIFTIRISSTLESYYSWWLTFCGIC